MHRAEPEVRTGEKWTRFRPGAAHQGLCPMCSLSEVDENGTSVPTFSPYVVGGVYLALLPLTLVALLRLKDAPTRFLVLALWLRYLLSAFHQYTYPPIVGGLSLNAMASITLTAIGFLVIERRLLLLKAFGGVYLVIVATMVSASINDPAEVVA